MAKGRNDLTAGPGCPANDNSTLPTRQNVTTELLCCSYRDSRSWQPYNDIMLTPFQHHNLQKVLGEHEIEILISVGTSTDEDQRLLVWCARLPNLLIITGWFPVLILWRITQELPTHNRPYQQTHDGRTP